MPALVAPTLAFVVAGLGILVIYRIVGRLRPGPVTRGFRLGQVISGGLLALAHGTNDAQKTMGVITLALIANGNLGSDAEIPFWVVVSAATAIALGTYMGGWRIIKTMGSRIIKMDTAQGFAAQGSGAAVILASSHGGFPAVHDAHDLGRGHGRGRRQAVSAVRWGVAGNIVVAWILTLPAAAAIGGATYGVTRLFGTGAAGPVIVAAVFVVAMAVVFARRVQQGSVITAAEVSHAPGGRLRGGLARAGRRGHLFAGRRDRSDRHLRAVHPGRRRGRWTCAAMGMRVRPLPTAR